jgi:hypothetical protein
LNIAKVALLLSVIFVSLVAASFCHLTGILNLHYDGVAHLNIARRVVDHPLPHYSHLGTVWLPLQHLLLLPWVQSDFLWSQGLAGTIVSVSAFWAACYYLFRLSACAYSQQWAGFLSVGAFALNPNLLYLQSTPLGEMLYIALFLAAMFHLLRVAERPGASVVPAGTAVLLASLTRYDSWLLVPFGALLLLSVQFQRHEKWKPCLFRTLKFCLVATLGIAGWLIYNQVAFDDPLSFARGEYSTQRNVRRIIREAGLSQYPPFQNVVNAVNYYGQAVVLSAGAPLVVLGSLGFVLFAWRRPATPAFWVLGSCFLLPPVFYIANMVRGTGIIYIPSLPPYGILNVRYAGLFLPGLCLLVPAAVEGLFQGLRFFVQRLRLKNQPDSSGLDRVKHQFGFLVLAGLLFFWVFQGTQGEEAITFYHEARVNGLDRKQADFQAATFLKAHYDGKRLLMDLGQHGIVPQQCRIPLIKIINEATDWKTALTRPSLFVSWIIVQEGDGVSTFPINWSDVHQHFKLSFRAVGPFEKPLDIYRRK